MPINKNLLIKIGTKGAKGSISALRGVGGAVTSIGSGALKATGAIGALGVGVATVSTKLAGDFQKNLLEVQTLMDENGQSMRSMSKELRNVAAQSGLALSSLSKAKYDIVSAGISGAAESAKVLDQAAQLAVGGVTSAAEAADILTTSINAMGFTADNVEEISDALFTTVRLGKTTMSELASSMGQVLPFARSMGLDLKGVGAAMATLTASGINTSQATTSLRAAIVSLTSPADKAKEAMEEAGISVKRFDDGSVDLVNTMKQFQGIDPDTMRKMVPRVEAVLGIQTMANNFSTLTKNVEHFATKSAGATQTAFEKMTGAFNTQFSKLRNNVHNIMIEVGDAIIKAIQPKIDAANKELERLGEIGWDNIANAITDNITPILETLGKSFNIFFNMVNDRLFLLKHTFLDAINPFVDKADQLKEMQKNLEGQMEASTSVIGQLFINMYSDIIAKAEEAAEKQKEAAQTASQVTTEAEVPVQDAKNITLGIIGKSLELRAGEIGAIKKVSGATIISEQAILAAKQKTMQQGLKGAMMQQQSAKDAMKAVIRAEAMEATAGLIANFFKNYPFPLSAVLAAGAGAIVSMAIDRNLSAIGFAEGGIVPGAGNQDSVPAMLTPGELILNRAQQENLVNNNSNITINISAPLVDETVVDSIIPAIQRATNLNLA